MFGNKKEQPKIESIFGDKNYQMKDKYAANELFIANFEKLSNDDTDIEPTIKTTEQKYIFEIINSEEPLYREVFTGFISSTGTKYYNLPYVINAVPFVDSFPEMAGLELPKLSLIWLQNDINYSKEKTKSL